jgi:AraC family transcriptional regulator
MAAADRLPCGCPRTDHATRNAGAYVVNRSTYLPVCRLGTHVHAEDRVVLTAYGAFDSVYGSRAFALDAHRVIYRPALAEHRDHYTSETACVTIRFSAVDETRSRAFDFADADMPAAAKRLWAELDTCDSASELALESLSAEILGRIASRPADERTRPQWIRRIRDRIEDEYANPPNLKAIASDVQRNASHVATAFRLTYGKSIGEFVRDVRIWRSRGLLDDPSIPLAEVAARGGFADQSHFARLFKRRFAMTPGEYRLRMTRGMAR